MGTTAFTADRDQEGNEPRCRETPLTTDYTVWIATDSKMNQHEHSNHRMIHSAILSIGPGTLEGSR